MALNSLCIQIWLVAVYFAPVQGRYPMVLAPEGKCKTKVAPVRMDATEENCNKMKGTFLQGFGCPGIACATYACRMDLCYVPQSFDLNMASFTPEDYIADGPVWGVGIAERVAKYGAEDKAEVTHGGATRALCEAIRGEIWRDYARKNCKTVYLRQPGMHRDNLTDIYLWAGEGCPSQFDVFNIGRVGSDCERNGGKRISEQTTWFTCQMGLCYNPISAVQCEPSDKWVNVSVCYNLSNHSVTCAASQEMGMALEEGYSTSSGASMEASLSMEVGVGLSDRFSATVSTEVSSGFDWSSTRHSAGIWSRRRVDPIEITVPPRTVSYVQQFMGVCGSYRVGTHMIRVVETPYHASK